MPAALARRVAVAALLAVFGTLPVVRAQPASGTYGVELRGAGDGSRIEARVGPNTAHAETSRVATVVPKSPQPFRVAWSPTEVRLTIGGQSIRYPATWRVGNAVRISARGGVRASVAVLGGRRVDKIIAGTPPADGTSELIVSGAYLTKSWTLDGAIDWPDEPTPADAVMVTTTTQDSPTIGEDPKNRMSFTGGVADPFVFSPPSGIQRRSLAATPVVTLTWTGGASALWSVTANWNPQRVPAAGDVMAFPDGPKGRDLVNDLANNPLLGGIIVSGRSYALGGNTLRLATTSSSRIEQDFTVDSLEGGGTIELAGQTVFTIAPTNETSSKTFSGTFLGGDAELRKDGFGELILTGDASSLGQTTVAHGTVILDGANARLGKVFVDRNGLFAIAHGGTTGALTVGNGGALGDPRAGIANTGNFEIDNADYFQTIGPGGAGQLLKVTGTVKISDNGITTLRIDLTGGYVPSPGTNLILIQNDGNDVVVDSPNNVFRDPITNGRLDEGQTFTADGVTFRISYKCNAEKTPAACDGTGNDIGLTAIQSGPRPDLTITKSKSGSFIAGETGAFTLHVTNVGTAATARLVTVTDTLPAGFAPNAASGTGWGCTITGQQVSCSRSDALAISASYPDITIDVQVALTAQDAVNAATVRVDGDQNTANDRAEVAVTVGHPIDLTIAKTHVQESLQQGGSITYRIVLSNAGKFASSGTVTVTDVIPGFLTPTSAAGSGWSCGIAQKTVTCSRDNALAPNGAYDTILIVAAIAANAPPSVTNTATLTGGGDVVAGNNSADDIALIGANKPDLTIAKSQVAPPFVPGQPGLFGITVTNHGPGVTSGLVTVTDTLPAGLVPTAAVGPSWTCNISGQTMTCTRSDSVGVGFSYPPIKLTVNVLPTAARGSNTATVSGGGDETPDNNSVTIPVDIAVTPAATPDLFVTKTHAPEPAAQGGTIAFTITVGTHVGAASSGNVTVIDQVPAGLTQIAASGTGWSCGVVSQTVTCQRSDSLQPDSTFPDITLTASVSPTATSDANRVTISGGGDGNLDNNSVTDPYTIAARSPDLTIAKTHSGELVPGQSATFSIVITNTGPVPTTGTVTMGDALPAGLTPTAASGTGWTCQIAARPVTCTRADALAAGASYPPITLVAAVAAGSQSGENLAVVSGGGDTTPDNNIAHDAFVVSVPSVPDLTLTKTHTGDFIVAQQGTYQVTVRNNGTGPTVGEVLIEDPLPLGLTPVSASGAGWACTIAGQTVDCRRSDSLQAGQPWPVVTIVVNVGLVAGSVNNIATVRGGGDPETENNSDVDAVTIVGRPQLTVSKAHVDPVVQGEQDLPFTIRVSNNGTGPTSGTVTVTDQMPAGLTPIDAAGSGWTCGIAAQTVTCTRADALAPATDYPSIQIRANVASGAVTVTNDVTVSGGGDTTPADNTFHDLVPITPAGQANLILAKHHDGDFSQGQQDAVYQITVGNFGVRPTAGDVTVTDDLPAGLTPASAVGTGWACSVAAQHVQCTRGDALGPGQSFPVIALTVRVAANATDVVNVAGLSGGGDQTPTDNTTSDATHIVPRAPDLTVTKHHADPFMVGQTDATYQITVQNVGTAPTTGEVTVTDRTPNGLVPLSAGGSGWTCGISAQTVTCRRSDSLAAGTAYPPISLRVDVRPGTSNLVNVVAVAGGGDATPGNNSASDATSINLSPDATIALNLTSPLIVAGDAEYQALVSNLGPGWLGGQTNVVVTFPNELVPALAEGAGWLCTTAGQQVTCARISSLGPNDEFSALRFRVRVRTGPSQVTVAAMVANGADSNPANNQATVSNSTVLPTTGVSIVKRTGTPRVEIGGAAAYQVDVTNTGEVRLDNVVIHDLLPRGFVLVDRTRGVNSSQRHATVQPVTIENGVISWPLGTLEAGEKITLSYQAIVGADARNGRQDNRATVDGAGPLGNVVQAGPATATVEVATETFTMLQALVGRVFEDVDGNGVFGGGDRPIANARVITSTGQAALTDPAGMYNIPSIGSGTVAVSLDRDTIPAGLTVDDGPGGRSWTRLLRTPIGGGTLLTQNFPLRRAASATTAAAIPTTPPDAADNHRVSDDPAAGNIPPRRDYETRQGSSLLIGLGEVSFGRAAQEFDLFQKDKDAWATGSVFYQGTVGSPKNQLTFAADSRRRLNGTTDHDRLFELDPNDRMYPVFGDASRRQEFATSNSKVFARLERGASHVMWGDLVGDLPSSATDGGRWSSYQRHLTGVEVRVADTKGDHVTLRGAQPETAYAREVFAGGQLGLITLGHVEVLQGTETVALEVRDRRLPDRLLERDVLARGVDYQLEPGSGTLFLQRNVSGLDPQLNLVQVVVTYEYQNQGLDHLVFNGRAAGTYRSVRGGMTFFTEEGVDNTRFTVAGLDLTQSLPHGGRWRLDLPYSHGTPNVAASVDTRPVNAGSNTDGFAIQADVEQPVEFWSGMLRASFLHADDNFRNPFSATITPGAGYASGSAELSPWTPTRLRFGGTYERYNTTSVDASRTTLSAEWAQTIGGHVTLKGGYDGRTLDQSGSDLNSGLFTAQALVKAGDRFQARIGREQNVKDDADPTYPDQTTLGARWKIKQDTSLFYTQRISDSAIVPVGDFATTGFSQLGTKGELNVGVESHVQDNTQLTSGYRVEQGINGPDAYAMIGVLTHVKLGRGLGTSFGLEHGQLVSGPDDSYTSGSLAVDWLPSERFKATTRYEGRDRSGYASLFTAGAAARLYAGFTGLTRIQWSTSDQATIGDAKAFLAALALRPSTNDRLGWLLSYQFVDRGLLLPAVAPGRDASGWRHLLSTDGYAQPIQWLELHGKFAWQRTDDLLGLSTDTYLWQGRGQVMFSTRFDGALEQRYIWQPASDSHRNGTALEAGFWPIADARVAVGYNFNDTRDPYGRDLQGRDKGVYLTLSTKLSYLFDLFGSKPPAAAQR